jgi:hypothetical protein
MMPFVLRRVILQSLCAITLCTASSALTPPSLAEVHYIRDTGVGRRRHQPTIVNTRHFATVLKAVPVLDEWKVMPDGRVEGRVSNHPDDDIEDGAIISTSTLLEPKRLSGGSRNIVVKTSSGSKYQLLNPIMLNSSISLSETESVPTSASTSIENLSTIENDSAGQEKVKMSEAKRLMTRVKDAGIAGIISYAFWEFGFWTVSVPVCIVAYRQVTGHWPDFSSQEDLQKLGAEAFAFVNLARFAVPLRIGLALGTTPWVQTNIVDRFTSPRA